MTNIFIYDIYAIEMYISYFLASINAAGNNISGNKNLILQIYFREIIKGGLFMKAWKFLGPPLMLMLLSGMPWSGVFAAAEDKTEPVYVDPGKSVTVGNVTVEDNYGAVGVIAESEQNASVKVEGNVTLTNQSEGQSGTAVYAEGWGADASANISKDVSATTKSTTFGVVAESGNDDNGNSGTATVKVGGSVSANSQASESMGVYSYNGDVTVEKNVVSEGPYSTGVYASSWGNANAKVTVKGALSATGKNTAGAGMFSFGDTSKEGLLLKVKDGITAAATTSESDNPYSEPDQSIGMFICNNGGKIQADITGNVTATINKGDAKGIWISDDMFMDRKEASENSSTGVSSIFVHGNLISSGVGICRDVVAESSSEEAVFSKKATVTAGSSSKADILVEDVIDANDVGVLFRKHDYYSMPISVEKVTSDSNSEYPDPNLNLTVWKINLNQRNNAAEWETYAPEPKLFTQVSDQLKKNSKQDLKRPEYSLASILPSMSRANTKSDSTRGVKREVARDFELNNIMYIIKVEQPGEGGTIKAVDANGNALKQSFDFDVAYEGDKIILKSNLAKGYKIVAAYNGIDKDELLSIDENGDYYKIVPKGGGVYLSVELEDTTEHNYAESDDDIETLSNDDASEAVPVYDNSNVHLAAPKTGDNAHIAPWLLLSVVNLGGIMVIEVCNRKRKSNCKDF